VAGARWRDLETRFGPGDLLLLYTDGVVEARDANRQFFGVPRLIEAASLKADNAAAIRENVLDAVTRHVGARPFDDDLTILVARGVAIEEAS
jgi:sigma-B regulation protein RsbU (phosphoserine phosphatase)